MRQGSLALLLGPVALASALLPGCSGAPADILNAAPQALVVAVRPEPGVPTASADLWVDVYIRDTERDPVDLRVSVRRGDGSLEPARIRLEPGQGISGLHSEPRAPGALHRLVWDRSGIPVDEALVLEIVPTDREGNEGLPTLTDVFEIQVGWTATR